MGWVIYGRAHRELCVQFVGDFRIQVSYAGKIRLLADRLQEAIPHDSFAPIPHFYA